MADEANRPLLDGQERSASPDPSPENATNPDLRPSFELSSESAPLLHRRDDDLAEDEADEESLPSPSATSWRPRWMAGNSAKKANRLRWPIVVSLALLTAGILVILTFAFAAPAAMKEYAQEAAVFEPTAISIDSTTPDGVRARVQGDFVMDSKRVKGNSIRKLGKFATWIAREIDTGDSDVEVYLPEYGNILIGNAALPSIKVDVRNGHHTKVDFLTDLTAGDLKGMHVIAMDWIEGRLGRLSIKGRATLHLKTGLLNLGTQILTDTFTLEETDLPALPEINVAKLDVHDAQNKAVVIDALVSALVHSPIALTIPALGFEIYVPNCSPGDPYIQVANANTAEVRILPGQPTTVGVEGLVRNLPDELTTTCPGGDGSPLDSLVSSYIRGLETTIYVRGADTPSSQAPAWIVDLLRSVTVPLPFTGHALDNLVKNFTMTDTHFSLPDPFAEPGTPGAQPSVSALVKVLIDLPKQVNFNVDVPRVRAISNVYYKDKVLGVLDIPKWQKANSTLVRGQDGSSGLLVQFAIKDVPLEVTDNDVLTDIIQTMLFGSGGIMLHVAATVDTKVSTGLGLFALRGIPADGDVRVKTPSGKNAIGHLNPRVVSLQLGTTTESSLLVSTKLNFTNPTEYSATIPFVDTLMLYNGTTIAHIIAHNISVVPGSNTNVSVDFAWNPLEFGGMESVEAGRALLSSYISGANTTVTLKTHNGTIPTLPGIGEALSIIHIDVPVPQLSTPGSPDDDAGSKRPHFIQDATFYLWSSSAQFTLFSPLAETTIAITSVDATAFYEKDKPVGKINYKDSFDVPPGSSQTPRLPVDLVVGGIGYDALRKALGQSLQMDAVARVGVRIENYTDVVYYHGKGIAAKPCDCLMEQGVITPDF